MIKEVIRDLLAADVAVTAALATYRFATGSAKSAAIFTMRKIPDDAEYPCVFISQTGAEWWGTRGNKGGVFSIDVSVYGNAEQSDEDLWDLAEAVWVRLDRADALSALTAIGYDGFGIRATPPQQVGGDGTLPQYVVQVSVTCLKN